MEVTHLKKSCPDEDRCEKSPQSISEDLSRAFCLVGPEIWPLSCWSLCILLYPWHMPSGSPLDFCQRQGCALRHFTWKPMPCKPQKPQLLHGILSILWFARLLGQAPTPAELRSHVRAVGCRLQLRGSLGWTRVGWTQWAPKYEQNKTERVCLQSSFQPEASDLDFGMTLSIQRYWIGVGLLHTFLIDSLKTS